MQAAPAGIERLDAERRPRLAEAHDEICPAIDQHDLQVALGGVPAQLDRRRDTAEPGAADDDSLHSTALLLGGR